MTQFSDWEDDHKGLIKLLSPSLTHFRVKVSFFSLLKLRSWLLLLKSRRILIKYFSSPYLLCIIIIISLVTKKGEKKEVSRDKRREVKKLSADFRSDSRQERRRNLNVKSEVREREETCKSLRMSFVTFNCGFFFFHSLSLSLSLSIIISSFPGLLPHVLIAFLDIIVKSLSLSLRKKGYKSKVVGI